MKGPNALNAKQYQAVATVDTTDNKQTLCTTFDLLLDQDNHFPIAVVVAAVASPKPPLPGVIVKTIMATEQCIRPSNIRIIQQGPSQ